MGGGPHETFMARALALAAKGVATVSPNPAVGAVVVEGGRVVASGYHERAGGPHAEIVALRRYLKAGRPGKGATLYVTLEPCCHWGRTPPCTGAIIASGVKRVVLGALDPNPRVSGAGVRELKAAGISVVSGVLEGQCAGINAPFEKYITTGLPFVTLKLAMSLDGRIAAASGKSKWITGQEARAAAHSMRALADAVMVGSRTVLKDDPELTVRLVKGLNPRRVVVDSMLSTDPRSAAYRRRPNDRRGLGPIVFTSDAAPEKKARRFADQGVEVVRVGRSSSYGGLDLKGVLRELARREAASLLVEGGGRLAASFVKGGLADKAAFFYAPIILGSDALAAIGPLGIKGIRGAAALKEMVVTTVGRDMLVEGAFAGKKERKT